MKAAIESLLCVMVFFILSTVGLCRFEAQEPGSVGDAADGPVFDSGSPLSPSVHLVLFQSTKS